MPTLPAINARRVLVHSVSSQKGRRAPGSKTLRSFLCSNVPLRDRRKFLSNKRRNLNVHMLKSRVIFHSFIQDVRFKPRPVCTRTFGRRYPSRTVFWVSAISSSPRVDQHVSSPELYRRTLIHGDESKQTLRHRTRRSNAQ